jgi:hypothetical protein
MSGLPGSSPTPPVPYHIVTSAKVDHELNALVARADGLGMRQQVIDALDVLLERLQIYPQFGQPLLDLQHEQAQLWVATVPPLVVRYAIYESRREVWIVTPIQALSGSGL